MDRKTITALMLAFMVVKTPVSLAGAKVYAEPLETQANAISEAHIAENINISNQNTKTLTTEDKAQAEMSKYRAQLEAEAARIKAEEEARIARENAGRIATLRAAGLSATYIQQYVNAEKQLGVPWQLIAAVHYTETGQRGDTAITSYAGAQGPMQFMPSTFNAYALDGDGDGVANIGDVDDAILTGAHYLAANGAASGNITGALLRYNHDMGYVNHVYSIARSLGLK